MAYFITEPKVKFVSLRKGDQNFHMSNGISLTPRASIDISKNCPSHIAQQIVYYYERGYIQAVANMTEQELMMSSLSK